MNNKEFIQALASRTGESKDKTQKFVTALVSAMSDTFDGGDSVTIANFGTFEPKKRLERIITNPTTGQRMLVPPKIALTFKASQAVRNMTKGGDE